MKIKFRFVAILFSILFFQPLAHAEVPQVIHQVRSGESLWNISRQYKVPVQEIIRINHLRNPRSLDVGQKLRIPDRGYRTRSKPADSGAPPKVAPAVSPDEPRVLDLPFKPQQGDLSDERFKELNQICALDTDGNKLYQWQYIVIHHSATPNGGARAFDYYHRAKRHMQNGLAYHFVIDNGNGGPDGRVEAGSRWKKQIRGGHSSNQDINEIGIGICLVGNFENNRPSRRQMASLVALVKYLQGLTGISSSNVILHREVKQKSTLCPGHLFPADDFRNQLDR